MMERQRREQPVSAVHSHAELHVGSGPSGGVCATPWADRWCPGYKGLPGAVTSSSDLRPGPSNALPSQSVSAFPLLSNQRQSVGQDFPKGRLDDDVKPGIDNLVRELSSRAPDRELFAALPASGRRRIER